LRFAENEFSLNERQDDGGTLRKHLEIVARQTGSIPKELEPIECPDAMIHVWRMFLELTSGRGNNGFGINPISYPDILAWACLVDSQPTPMEIRAIKAVDAAFMQQQAKTAKKQLKN
jgi:hypothetical protein